MLEGYLPFSISVFLGLKDIKLDTTQDIVNGCLSIFFMFVLIIYPFFTFLFVQHFKNRLTEPRISDRISAIYMLTNL
jgi:hypothetical protein